jgi:hypothetical protein
VGPVEESHWLSDGYGDSIRHFVAGMGAISEWAPPGEDHIVRSSSVVAEVGYGPRAIRDRTFDAEGEDVLRLPFSPGALTADGRSLGRTDAGVEPGWRFDPGTAVLRVHRSAARRVQIEEREPLFVPVGGCGVRRGPVSPGSPKASDVRAVRSPPPPRGPWC